MITTQPEIPTTEPLAIRSALHAVWQITSASTSESLLRASPDPPWLLRLDRAFCQLWDASARLYTDGVRLALGEAPELRARDAESPLHSRVGTRAEFWQDFRGLWGSLVGPALGDARLDPSVGWRLLTYCIQGRNYFRRCLREFGYDPLRRAILVDPPLLLVTPIECGNLIADAIGWLTFTSLENTLISAVNRAQAAGKDPRGAVLRAAANPLRQAYQLLMLPLLLWLDQRATEDGRDVATLSLAGWVRAHFKSHAQLPERILLEQLPGATLVALQRRLEMESGVSLLSLVGSVLRQELPESKTTRDSTGTLADRTPDPAPGPEDFVLREEAWRSLTAQLTARLTPSQAEVLRLRLTEDLTEQRIAERMGVAKGTVSQWRTRIKDKTREMLGE